MLGATLARRLDARADRELCRVGVEHELQVWAPDGQQDFRLLIPRVAGPVGVPHPGDPRARWLASGLALTADGWEAELVTPPLALRRDAPDRIAAMLDLERVRLLHSLHEVDPHVRLVGFSTHVNVSVDDRSVVAVAREFAARCAVAAGLLLDGADSPGVLIRPRRGRLEICGEYATGADFAAAIVFVAAAAAVLARPGASLPAVGRWRVEPARERFGYFVGRDAVGADLYAAGRRARVPLAGRTVLAQEHLEEVWSLARPYALSLDLDPAPVDDRVWGAVPLPVERSAGDSTHTHSAQEQPASGEPLTPAGPDTRVRQRGDLRLTPAWLTWSTVAWRCEDVERGRTAYAVMPLAYEPHFLEQVDAGALDGLLARSIRRRARRVLASADQTRRPDIWRDVRPEALVPAERDRSGEVLRSGTGSGSGSEGQAKERSDESTTPSPSPSPDAAGRASSRVAAAAETAGRHGLPLSLVIAAAVILALVGGGVVWALTRGDDAASAAQSTPSVTDSVAPTDTATSPSEPDSSAESPVDPADSEFSSIVYSGTLDSGPGPGGGPREAMVAISCTGAAGRDCSTSHSFSGWDLLSGIQLDGPGTYTATLADAAFNPCLPPTNGSGPPTTITVTIDAGTLSFVVETSESPLVDCGDGTSAQTLAARDAFEGVYVEGSIPGIEP